MSEITDIDGPYNFHPIFTFYTVRLRGHVTFLNGTRVPFTVVWMEQLKLLIILCLLVFVSLLFTFRI